MEAQPSVVIRTEGPDDHDAVRELLTAAFESDAEAHIVERLRTECPRYLALVAERALGASHSEIIGQIVFSPARLVGQPDANFMGLAPMAVAPAYQRQGVGSLLVHEGLMHCLKAGAQAVVVLGHPSYYPRFGFRPAGEFGLGCEYEVPDDVFMVLELIDNGLANRAGLIQYAEPFRAAR